MFTVRDKLRMLNTPISRIMNFMKGVRECNAPMICGDGSHSMGFVNLDDVMDTNVLAAESDI